MVTLKHLKTHAYPIWQGIQQRSPPSPPSEPPLVSPFTSKSSKAQHQTFTSDAQYEATVRMSFPVSPSPDATIVSPRPMERPANEFPAEITHLPPEIPKKTGQKTIFKRVFGRQPETTCPPFLSARHERERRRQNCPIRLLVDDSSDGESENDMLNYSIPFWARITPDDDCENKYDFKDGLQHYNNAKPSEGDADPTNRKTSKICTDRQHKIRLLVDDSSDGESENDMLNYSIPFWARITSNDDCENKDDMDDLQHYNNAKPSVGDDDPTNRKTSKICTDGQHKNVDLLRGRRRRRKRALRPERVVALVEGKKGDQYHKDGYYDKRDRKKEKKHILSLEKDCNGGKLVRDQIKGADKISHIRARECCTTFGMKDSVNVITGNTQIFPRNTFGGRVKFLNNSRQHKRRRPQKYQQRSSTNALDNVTRKVADLETNSKDPFEFIEPGEETFK